MTWLAEPQNIRVGSGALMALATSVRVVAIGWVPPTWWLVFLLAWAGIDVAPILAQKATDFVAARRRDRPTVES